MATRYPKKGPGKQWTVKELESIPLEWGGDTLSDGDGLFGEVRVSTKGLVSVRWRYTFRDKGTKKWYQCGTWPKSTLSAIRTTHAEARRLIAEGHNPTKYKTAERIKEKQKVQEAIRQEQERKLQALMEQKNTLGSYLEGPYTEVQSRKRSGHDTLSIIRNNFEHLFDKPMNEISKTDISEWQAKREKLGRSYETIRRAFGALKTMLNRAVHDEIIDSNPLSKIRLERRSSNETAKYLAKTLEKRRPLTQEEISALHAGLEKLSERTKEQRRNSRAHGKPHLPCLEVLHYPHWFVPFTYVGLFTGLRVGDIFSLAWGEELSLKDKRLTKFPNKTQHHPEPALVSMMLPDQLIDLLTPWWEQHDHPLSGPVFPSSINGGFMDHYAYRRHWKTVLELSKLDANLNFYALRHNFISALIGNGIPLFEVARLAGHKSTAMIEKHYGHLLPENAQAAMAAIGSQFMA